MKNHIFFPKVLKRWSIQKTCSGIWYLLYYQERWYFFFLKIWSCSLDTKWKVIFLKKHIKIWYFLQIFWKDGLCKKKSHWNMIFLVFCGKMAFFYPKIYFFIGRKMKDDLSQEMHGNMIFSVYMYKCSKYYITLLPRKSKTIFSRENSLKSDWHSILTF